MKKLALGGLLAVVLLVAAFLYFGAEHEAAAASPCERDCINDSGGIVYCTNYCAHNDHYGPPSNSPSKP